MPKNLPITISGLSQNLSVWISHPSIPALVEGYATISSKNVLVEAEIFRTDCVIRIHNGPQRLEQRKIIFDRLFGRCRDLILDVLFILWVQSLFYDAQGGDSVVQRLLHSIVHYQ